MSGDLFALNGRDIRAVLEGKELAIMEAVQRAYVLHQAGHSSLPHSLFLRFPDKPRDRIIALPAFLGGDDPVAGLKWIASFPGNHDLALPRASALLLLNSVATGRPEVVLESSYISAKRTAASAVLAARHMNSSATVEDAGLIGCGPIGFEIVRFLKAEYPALRKLVLFDLDPERSDHFATRCREAFPDLQPTPVRDFDAVVASTAMVVFATTAGVPHVSPETRFQPGTTVLHVSLRDLPAEMILAADNVVDDVDHVCRENTSIHLAEKSAGNRDFVRCTLADIVDGKAPGRADGAPVSIFSPFGLGVLDLIVAQIAVSLARECGLGQILKGFLPDSAW